MLMRHDLLRPLLAASVALLAAAVPAQELRRAALEADFVAVARHQSQREHESSYELHTLEIVRAVAGASDKAPKAVVVIDYVDVRRAMRPGTPTKREGQTQSPLQLYCLQDASREAKALSLPAANGPYFTLSQRAGSNPIVGDDLDADPTMRFCSLLFASEAGRAPQEIASQLVTFALQDHAATRIEAAKLLTERPLVAARVTDLQWGDLLARTSAETADSDYKLALFELCATRRMPGLVDAMMVSLDKERSPRFARAVGALCAATLGDDAARPMVERLRNTAEPEARKSLLLALGATKSKQALEALLKLKQVAGSDPAIEAALREHARTEDAEAKDAASDKKPIAPQPPRDGGQRD
jgi:hypothetical protein